MERHACEPGRPLPCAARTTGGPVTVLAAQREGVRTQGEEARTQREGTQTQTAGSNSHSSSLSRRSFVRIAGLAGITLALGGGLAGCAPDPNVLRVGTKIDVPGFGFQNPETGNIEGMEVDIARELAKRIKGDPNALQVTGVNVTTRGAMLDNGTLDATLATFTITEARKKSYNFSRPYYTDHIGVLVKKSSGITDLRTSTARPWAWRCRPRRATS